MTKKGGEWSPGNYGTYRAPLSSLPLGTSSSLTLSTPIVPLFPLLFTLQLVYPKFFPELDPYEKANKEEVEKA